MTENKPKYRNEVGGICIVNLPVVTVHVPGEFIKGDLSAQLKYEYQSDEVIEEAFGWKSFFSR